AHGRAHPALGSAGRRGWDSGRGHHLERPVDALRLAVSPYLLARDQAAMARPVVTTGTQPKVLYIAGPGRSGSTVLDQVLGELPGFVSTGELQALWQRGLVERRPCGCSA